MVGRTVDTGRVPVETRGGGGETANVKKVSCSSFFHYSPGGRFRRTVFIVSRRRARARVNVNNTPRLELLPSMSRCIVIISNSRVKSLYTLP